MKKTKFYEVFERKEGRHRRLYTKNLNPGKDVYGEYLIKEGKTEYRQWDPKRSKIAAAILKGLNQLGAAPGQSVLYLGASTGTTVSHISDIVGNKGMVFALDFAPRTTRDLVFLAKERENIAPILADANQPETFKKLIPKEVDWIFQDIAQRQQAEIFLKNVKQFLKKGGLACIAIKARSVDVSKKPRLVFKDVRKLLEKEVVITDYRTLDPFEKDHAFFTVKKK
ncbi:MAG: fibrillarin-like rRNA/tRNA 2'-O-methyltransferase [Candidatus Nanoarchaeia archaeon]